jgi:hypothetical protein
MAVDVRPVWTESVRKTALLIPHLEEMVYYFASSHGKK